MSNGTQLQGKITQMSLAKDLTGEEYLEIIQLTAQGTYHNVRLPVAALVGEQGEQGLPGLSAYEVAVEQGFDGSVSEWLESLIGPDGAPGERGQSAYDVALAEGFDGDIDAWLDSLQGPSAYRLAQAQGFSGDEAAWLESLQGKSAFEVAKDLGFSGSEADWLETLVGPGGERGESAYEAAVRGGFEGDESEFLTLLTEGGKGSGGGGIWITQVTPQSASDNVSERVYADDDTALVECASTSPEVNVTVLVLPGSSRFIPKITVNDLTVTLTQIGDTPSFQGTVAVTVAADGKLTAVHEDGAVWNCDLRFDEPPAVVSATFTAPYPAGQTELKEDDRVTVQVTADGPIVGYEIRNSGALKAAAATVAATTSLTLENLRVANRGNTTQSVGVEVRVRKANGAWSAWFDSSSIGVVDGVHVVKLNNLHPTITITGVTYPDNQAALKDTELATVNHTVSNYDRVEYVSANGQLDIPDPTTYASAKLVARVQGNYNDSVENFTVTAYRDANGALTSRGTVVRISQEQPVITVTTPAARLRSGGLHGTEAQLYTITLTSTQALREAPSLNAPEGDWVEPAFSGNATGKVWTRRLRVHDTDAKGEFSWNSLKAINGAGVEQNALSGQTTYTLGGFVFRTLSVPAFPNREAEIGTHVVDPAKLRVTNLSKGGSGSLNTTYQDSMQEQVDRYTITGPSGMQNPQGTHWYNADGANAASNTSGTMRIEIEEVI